jgi:hypothetical protein
MAWRELAGPTGSIVDGEILERATGIEPVTSSLGSWHSTAELRPLEDAAAEFL